MIILKVSDNSLEKGNLIKESLQIVTAIVANESVIARWDDFLTLPFTITLIKDPVASIRNTIYRVGADIVNVITISIFIICIVRSIHFTALSRNWSWRLSWCCSCFSRCLSWGSSCLCGSNSCFSGCCCGHRWGSSSLSRSSSCLCRCSSSLSGGSCSLSWWRRREGWLWSFCWN